MTRRPLAFCALVASLAAILLAAPARAQAPALVEWKLWTDRQELRVGDYVLRGENRRDTGGPFTLHAMKGGNDALTISAARILFHESTLGQDIAGSGQPALALLEWSGKESCCYRLQIVEMGDRPRVVAGIDIQHVADGRFPRLADRDGRPGMEIELADLWAFYGDLLAGSPAPQVVLRLQGGAWVADGALMRKAPPAEAELLRMADAAHDTYVAAPSAQVWSAAIASPFLALVYQGNLAAACRFHERAFPDDDYKEASLLKLLEDVNRRSRRADWNLWPALAQANGIAETAMLDCPR